MIWQGGDGLSRGDFSSGVMAGERFLKLLPLHQSVLERQPGFREKPLSWCPNGVGRTRNITSLEDWLHKVFQDPNGFWIWCPLPVLAKVAAEHMCEPLS